MLSKKIINKNKKEMEYVMSERSIMADLSHPFLVGLKYAFQTERKLYYVMEFVPG